MEVGLVRFGSSPVAWYFVAVMLRAEVDLVDLQLRRNEKSMNEQVARNFVNLGPIMDIRPILVATELQELSCCEADRVGHYVQRPIWTFS